MKERFQPKFDASGLLTAVVTDAGSGQLLMVAHMNEEAIRRTIDSGRAWFWSRSRQQLWMKGESSGNVLSVADILVDCDQDCLWLKVHAAGPACHTGARSCFYRRLEGETLSPAQPGEGKHPLAAAPSNRG